MTKNATHYVDKKELLADILEWQRRCAEAEEQGKPKPKIPDSIGAAIIEIANRTASRPNFRNYTYIDEMISDAIADCVKGVSNFNPEIKGKAGEVNPFGYFSRIVWFAFLSRIELEKKHQKAKIESMFDPTGTETYSRLEGDSDDYNVSDCAEMLDFYYGSKIYE